MARGRGQEAQDDQHRESVDVGGPVKAAYNQWTQYSDFPSFTKKVESAGQPEDGKVNWKAQVFWSHRTWEATVTEQAQDDKIVWWSKPKLRVVWMPRLPLACAFAPILRWFLTTCAG